MAGISTTIRVDGDDVLQRAFARALGLGASRPAILKEIGEANLIATRARFRAERDPDGRPWAPLSEQYRRRARGRKILQVLGMRGGLLGTIAWQLVPEGVAVGTNREYARIHQLGGSVRAKHERFLRAAKRGKRAGTPPSIPARPYLGVSAADRAEFVEIVNDAARRRIEEGR